jgi:hypothetical protein
MTFDITNITNTFRRRPACLRISPVPLFIYRKIGVGGALVVEYVLERL